MEHLHANRADFIQKVQEALMTDLDMNGFQLESVSITHSDQTAFEHFNENNAFECRGTDRAHADDRAAQPERQQPVARDRAGGAFAGADLSARRAEQATAIATAEAEQTRLAEIARITAMQAQTVAQTEAAGSRAIERSPAAYPRQVPQTKALNGNGAARDAA